MIAAAHCKTHPRLSLHAETARDIMHADPLSIRAEATLPEILAFFTQRNVSAAPVMNAAGRPIGVISRSDVLVHHSLADAGGRVEYFESPILDAKTDAPSAKKPPNAYDLMTPAVFAVGPDTPMAKVVADMVGLRVHRLFVVDDDGVLIGVISAMDVLRNLR